MTVFGSTISVRAQDAPIHDSRLRPYIGAGVGCLGHDDALGEFTLSFGIEGGIKRGRLYAGVSLGIGSIPLGSPPSLPIMIGSNPMGLPKDGPSGIATYIGAHL